MIAKLKIFGALVVALLLAVIALQNTEAVETHLLFWTVSLSRAALVFVSGILGFVVGLLVALWLVGPGKEKKLMRRKADRTPGPAESGEHIPEKTN